MIATHIAKLARPNSTRRESDDGYQPVIAVLADRWRVIECRDGIQWILQYRIKSPETHTRDDWRGRRYLRTRRALIARSYEAVPEISPSALAILHALPEHIEGDARLARQSEAHAGGERI